MTNTCFNILLIDNMFRTCLLKGKFPSRIEVNGHVPAESGPCPWPEVHRGCIQRTSIWVPGGAISHFGHFRIRMLLGKNGHDKVRRFYFFVKHLFYQLN